MVIKLTCPELGCPRRVNTKNYETIQEARQIIQLHREHVHRRDGPDARADGGNQ